MGVSIPTELIQSIKQANPIADVMRDVYGKKIGPDNKTVCDFHKDSSPSMHVYEDSYYCYVCDAGRKGQTLTLPDGEKITDAGSDVIAYVMNRERCNWHDAVRFLAARAGIPVPEERRDPEAERMKAERTASNRNFYHALKADPDAMAYLNSRGLDDSDIAKWRMGMVPWDYADRRYAGRIVFGMTEITWNPEKSPTIAMAYRAREFKDYVEHGFDMDDESKVKKLMAAKYINDPTSKIYEKKHYLYGLNEAQKAIKKYRHAVIMEGYMDVIMAHKNGLQTAVASCGTSITEEQVKLLSRYTKKVFLWLDGDNAGSMGMRRALPYFLKHGFDVQLVNSPQGLDPADLVQRGEHLIEYIKYNSKPAVQVMIDSVISDFDSIVNRARIDALEDLMPLMESIERPADKANYRAVIEQKLGVRL